MATALYAGYLPPRHQLRHCETYSVPTDQDLNNYKLCWGNNVRSRYLLGGTRGKDVAPIGDARLIVRGVLRFEEKKAGPTSP